LAIEKSAFSISGTGEMNRQTSIIQSREVVTNDAIRSCARPAVSVVITLFNYSAFITGCLDSVRATNAADLPGGFEVVVVDDSSTDASVKVVEEYLATNALPICLVKKKSNTGLADARNVGLLMARAPLIFILDADNEIRPDCLLAHYRTLADSTYAMAYGAINQFDHVTRKSLATMSHREWNVRELVSRPCIDAMAMIRKEPVLAVGGYSTEYGTILPQGWEDYDLWLKLAQAGYAGKLIPQVLSDYRVHSESMLQSTWLRQRELAAYFARKFHTLVALHDDLPTWFGVSRRELAVVGGQSDWLHAKPKSKPAKFIHRLIGKKLCRSLCKRLASVYAWLHP
jgi:glycosyltransferase involved in cell wall biosynthesis